MHWLEFSRRRKETGEIEVESLGRKFIVKMPEEQRARLPDPDAHFSAQLMKPLSQLFRLEWDPSSQRVIEIPNQAEIERQRLFYGKELASLPTAIAPEFRDLLRKIIKLEEISSDAIMISVNPMSFNAVDPREQALRDRLLNYYVNTVSYIYRFSELEPNQVRTNAKMLDEITAFEHSCDQITLYMENSREHLGPLRFPGSPSSSRPLSASPGSCRAISVILKCCCPEVRSVRKTHGRSNSRMHS